MVAGFDSTAINQLNRRCRVQGAQARGEEIEAPLAGLSQAVGLEVGKDIDLAYR